MQWMFRELSPTQILLVGQCPDCQYRTEVWLESADISVVSRKKLETHDCDTPSMHGEPAGITRLLQPLIASYQHVLVEGWGTNLPLHMWYWPAAIQEDNAELRLVNIPHTAPQTLVGSAESNQDLLFAFQGAMAALLHDPETSLSLGMLAHVEVLNATSIRISWLYALPKADYFGYIGGQSVLQLNDERGLAPESILGLPLASPVDGIMSLALQKPLLFQRKTSDAASS